MNLPVNRNRTEEPKQDFLEDTLLVFRPGNFPWLIKPIQARTPFKCAISGDSISPGQYVYRCFDRPVRLSPYGPARCLVKHARKNGDAILPEGYFAAPVPSCEALQAKFVGLETKRVKRLAVAAVAQLNDHAIAGSLTPKKG